MSFSKNWTGHDRIRWIKLPCIRCTKLNWEHVRKINHQSILPDVQDVFGDDFFFFEMSDGKQILWFDHCFGWLSIRSLAASGHSALNSTCNSKHRTACKKREKKCVFETFPLKLSFPPTVFLLLFGWRERERES